MSKGLIAYFAQNRVAANVLMASLIIGGLVAIFQLPIQNLPKFDLRLITVTIPSPGSTPKDIEEDIIRRVEESVIRLSGVERVVSEARQGFGKVVIEVGTFANPENVLDDVTNAVDAIDRFPAPSAEQPEIRLERLEIEALTLAISSDSATENELRTAAENIREELLELPAVSQHVELKGIRDREITIELDEEQLKRYNLTFAQIARRIKRDSVNLSFGELKTDTGGIVLHTISKRSTGEEFESMPLIRKLDGSLITLGEVASIKDGFADYELHSEVDGVPTVFAVVKVEENQSIDEIRDDIRMWLANKAFPKHIQVTIWNDQAGFSMNQIGNLVSNSLIGLAIVFLCLVAVFDLRQATWITIGIPLSFIGAVLFFETAGLTLNLSTIFAFFLMIGIVVDDAVVVGENIAAERQNGKNALDAAISGARSVAGPITIGAVTTAVAFVPFLFITEARYQVLTTVPFVVFFVLLISLVEAFLILPAHLSHEKPWSRAPLSDFQNQVRHSLNTIRSQVVAPIVSWSVRHTVLTPVVGLIAIVLALILISTDVVRVIGIDQARNVSDNITAEIEFPVGTPFATTLAEAQKIADAARLTDEQLEGESIKTVSVLVGESSKQSKAIRVQDETDANSSHIASVRLHFNDRPPRKSSIPEFERAWRENISTSSSIQNLEFQSTRVRKLPNFSYSLRHKDREVLKSAAEDFRKMLESEPGLYGLTDNTNLGKRQLEIKLSPEGTQAGISLAGLGSQLRSSFHGLEVQRIQRNHDEIKVIVRYPRYSRESLSVLSTERIRSSQGREIPLSTVADISESQGLANLTRINGENAVFVDAYADDATVAPIPLRRKISKTYIAQLHDQYPGLTIAADGGFRNEIKLFKTLAILLPLVFVAMYAIVAGFLRSYWKPLIVVLGIPVAFAGAIFSHWILGWDFTFLSIFGVVAVSGVIVNDSLVLLDRYNIIRNERPGVAAIAIASEAMHHRFRAVFLTSLTTIVGLSPLLYERSESLLTMVPFVVSMLGGLVFAGLFTLFILPTLVMTIEGRKE